MNIADFTSGQIEDRYRYKAFLPERICQEWVVPNRTCQSFWAAPTARLES